MVQKTKTMCPSVVIGVLENAKMHFLGQEGTMGAQGALGTDKKHKISIEKTRLCLMDNTR